MNIPNNCDFQGGNEAGEYLTYTQVKREKNEKELDVKYMEERERARKIEKKKILKVDFEIFDPSTPG